MASEMLLMVVFECRPFTERLHSQSLVLIILPHNENSIPLLVCEPRLAFTLVVPDDGGSERSISMSVVFSLYTSKLTFRRSPNNDDVMPTLSFFVVCHLRSGLAIPIGIAPTPVYDR